MKNSGYQKEKSQSNFIANLQNALAANPDVNTANERHALGLNKQNPSFTIPVPSQSNNM